MRARYISYCSGSSSVQLELRVLLSLEQVGNILPQMSIMHPDEDSLALHVTSVISAPNIIKLCQPPRNILRIINNFRLEAIDHQVYMKIIFVFDSCVFLPFS